MGIMLVVAVASGAFAKSDDDEVRPLNRDPSDPAAVRDAMSEGTPVVTRSGKKAGYLCGGPVVLPGEVEATPVCALNGSGKIVGYMPFGNVGFVDRKTGRDRKALATLVRCYDELVEFAIRGTTPFTKECRAALKAQGLDVSQFKRATPEQAQKQAEHEACISREMRSPTVDLNTACPWPP
jgi:hypothetical protein